MSAITASTFTFKKFDSQRSTVEKVTKRSNSLPGDSRASQLQRPQRSSSGEFSLSNPMRRFSESWNGGFSQFVDADSQPQQQQQRQATDSYGFPMPASIDLKKFLTTPVCKTNGIVHCYIKRQYSVSNLVYPKYCVYLKGSDQFIMTSTKSTLNQTNCASYAILMDKRDVKSAEGTNVLGKVVGNYLGTEFTIFGEEKKPTEDSENTAKVDAKPEDDEVDKENQKPKQFAKKRPQNQLGTINYSSNVIKAAPRQMKVSLPALEDETYEVYHDKSGDTAEEESKCEEDEELGSEADKENRNSSNYAASSSSSPAAPSVASGPHTGKFTANWKYLPTNQIGDNNSLITPTERPVSTTSRSAKSSKSGKSFKTTTTTESMEANQKRELTHYINKPPRWNAKVGGYELNFACEKQILCSVKNFQLVDPNDMERVVLQFGKTGKDEFTLDFQWPMSPMQAFAIVLSSFDFKIACV